MKSITKIKTIAIVGLFVLILNANGQTWQPLTQTYSNFTSADKKVFASPIGNTVIMGYKRNATPSTSHISMDGGNTWQTIFADKPMQAALFAPNGNIFLATVKRYLSTQNYNPDTLFRSPDGMNWTNLGTYSGSGANQQDKNDFYVTGNNTLFVPGVLNGGHLLTSVDNGVTWTKTSNAVPSPNKIESVCASYSGDTIIVGTINSGVRYSHDGGTTFTAATGGGWGAATVGGVVILPNGDIYAAVAGGISKSVDGGVTFTALTYNPYIAMTITQFLYHQPSGKFFASAVQGIFESTDCITWTNITGNLTDVNLVVDMALSKDYIYVTKSNEDNLYRYAITGPTDVSELADPSAISLYPNPANEVVTIMNLAKGSNVRVLDVTGKVFFSSEITNEQATIPTDHFDSGMYIIRIEKNGIIENRKLLVNR